MVAVMVILLGAALPLLKTGLQGRRIRETSRQMNTYVELAKAMAAETGRPAGLILQVKSVEAGTLPENDLPYVSEVFLAQTPRPYAGDMVDERAAISGNTAAFSSASLPILVRPGDQIRFDYKGPMYNIDTVSWPVPCPFPPPAAPHTITFSGSPLPPGNVNLPFQILRQPEKSSSAPMELASEAVIDLSMSGFGRTSEYRFDNDRNVNVATVEIESVVIVFSPSGQMTRVIVNKYDIANNRPLVSTYTPTDTLHLLIGSIDGVLLDNIVNINSVGPDLVPNIKNPDNLWISIGHQTGRATTAENGWTEPPVGPVPAAFMAVVREFAQSGEAMGGR